jgi:hypothetical protein
MQRACELRVRGGVCATKPERATAPARYALRTAMKNTALLALLAGLAIGCAPSSTPTDGGTAESKEDARLAQKDPETGKRLIQENGLPEGLSVEGSENAGEAQAGEKTAEPKAQGTQPSAPPQGGQQPGGRQGMSGGSGNPAGRGGRGFNIAMMLGNEQVRALVQKELSLSDDQVTKLQALAPQPGAGQQDMSDEERAKQREELQKKINDVLNPAQEQRVKEIQLQMRGTRALTSDEVVKELGLSAKQVTDIEAALQVQRPQGGGPGGAQPSDEDRQKMMEEFQKAREAANAKALAVLTPAQKSKWEKMLGKKFEMPMMGGFGGRAGGGAAPRAGGAGA